MSRVLIAEDEPALLESYYEIVSAMGHECLKALDGDEALDLARRCHPDLVITDHMLPGRTGLELARALRVDPLLRSVPVIVISAGRPPEQEQKEAWRFLYKPVGVERFEKTVEEGLHASAATLKTKASSARSPRDVSPVSMAREEMLSWVSHEIKSPLSAALAASELARRAIQSGDSASVDKRLVTIMRQLARMNELVNSLLDAAQLQDGRLELHVEPMDLTAVTKESIAYFQELHPEVRFEFFDGKPLNIEGDPLRLRQVLDNLLSNACKYGRPANHVTVRVEADATQVSLSVTDRGAGVPEQELASIFDRFHRVPGHGGRGHGLGLYIAAALARLHGGDLSVTSEVGSGSTFTLTFPR